MKFNLNLNGASSEKNNPVSAKPQQNKNDTVVVARELSRNNTTESNSVANGVSKAKSPLRLGGSQLPPKAAPKKSLAEMLAAGKQETTNAETESTVRSASPLSAILAKQKEGQSGTSIIKPNANTPTTNTDIPPVTSEKYQIIENASEFLKDEVIDDFTAHMQAVLDAMGTLEIGTAMERVLVYAQNHAELVDILRPADIQIFVRGARASYAKVLAAKTTRKKKVTKKSAQLSATASEIDDIFADVEIKI